MMRGLLGLLVFQLIGELLVAVIDAPIPGPVVGLVLLFGWLQWRSRGHVDRAPETSVEKTGMKLLTHLQLFFVPAGVGVIVYLDLLADEAWPVLAGLIGSWVLGMLAVAFAASGAARVAKSGSKHG